MRIFLKIFLSFWLTLIVTGAAVAWVGYQLRGQVEEAVREEMAAEAELRGRLRTALEGEGAAAARALLEGHPLHGRIYLFDAAGRELLDREPPERLRRRPPSWEQGEQGEKRRRPPHELEVTAADGGRYRILTAPPPPFPRLLLRNPLPLLAALLVSGLLVFLLARHFSAPIRRLRRAAGRLAEGELDARVGPVRRFVPDELSELAADFDHMAEHTERLVQAHKVLLRDVSHELRSPLARLRVALGLAERRYPQAGEELGRMEQELERLDQLIGQVLTLARLEAGGEVRREEWVDLAGLLETVVGDADFEARQGERHAELTVPAQAALLMANAALLRSALENVIRNAVRYTAPGSVVEVGLERSDERCRVTVRDFGPGVPTERLGHIFEPFVRIGEARDRAGGGYGLGLAIAARAVRAHGGRIEAVNHPGGGLLVTIELPGCEAEPAGG